MNEDSFMHIIGPPGLARSNQQDEDPEKLRQRANEIEKEQRAARKATKRRRKEDRQRRDAQDVLHSIATNPKSSDEDRVEAARILLGSY